MKIYSLIVVLILLSSVNVLAAPDIEVLKYVSNSYPMTNEVIEFTVQVNNIGDEVATNVVIVDLLPDEMNTPANEIVLPSIGTYDSVTGEWIIGNLDSGAVATLVIPVVIIETQPPDCIVNFAISEFNDGHNDNDYRDQAKAAVYQTGIERCVDIDVNFNFSIPETIPPFNCDFSSSYEGYVLLSNNGPDGARNIVITIAQDPVLGPNLRLEGNECNNAPSAQCQITEIAGGETVRLTITSDLFQNYSTVNQRVSVSATSSDTDYYSENNDEELYRAINGFSHCDLTDNSNISLGGGCFIATAAYGSPLDQHIDTLRDFRDRYLLTNTPGRKLVALYYNYSPPIADFIADRDWLRTIVRALITPLVFMIEYPESIPIIFLGIPVYIHIHRRKHNLKNITSV